jgi:hypothetical protein
LLPGVANARQTMDKAAFDRLVDYVNAELTKTYIEKILHKLLQIAENRSSYREPYKDSIEYKDKIEQVLLKNTISNPVSFETLSRLLENRFTVTLSRVSKQINDRKTFYNDNLSNAKLVDNVLNVTFNNAIKVLIDDRMKSLRSELKDYFENKETQLSEDIVKKELATTQPNKSNKSKKDDRFLIYICMFGLLYCIGVCSYLLYTKMNKNKEL